MYYARVSGIVRKIRLPLLPACLLAACASVAQPVVSHSPDSLGVTFNTCDSSATLSYKIYNTGSSTLNYRLLEGERKPTTYFDTAYVFNPQDNNISIVDLTSFTVAGTIPSGNYPWHGALSPDARELWVSNRDDNQIRVYSTANNALLATINTSNYPGGIAFTNDGRFAYVACQNANAVDRIDVATRTVVNTITASISGPRNIRISPDGSVAYVANDNGMAVIDLATDNVIASDNTRGTCSGIAFTPDGTRVYVSESCCGDGVHVYDAVSHSYLTTIFSGFSQPNGLAMSPDGRYLYIGDQWNGRIAVVEVATNNVVESISHPDLNGVWDLAVTPDGRRLIADVAWNNDDIWYINLETSSISSSIDVNFNGSWGLATLPGGLEWTAQDRKSGTVAAADSTTVNVVFDGTGVISGTYQGYLFIFSDDPSQPVDTIRLGMVINGIPVLQLIDTCSLHDTTFVGGTSSRFVYLTNTGCDTVFVTNITSSLPVFAPEGTSGYILPGDTVDLRIDFSPTAITSYSGTLTLFSNAGDSTLCLEGVGIAAPVISVNPDSFYVTLSCSDTLDTTLTIYNTGPPDLIVDTIVKRPAGTDLAFEDDFESGDFSSWTTEAGAYTREVTADEAAQGDYSFRQTGGNFNYYDGISHTFAAMQANYVSFYVMSPPGQSQWNCGVGIGDNNITATGGLADFWIDNSSSQFYLYSAASGTWWTAMTPGQWHKIEFRNIDYSTRTFDYYVNGNLEFAGFQFWDQTMNELTTIHLMGWDPGHVSYYDEFLIGNEPFLSCSPNSGAVPNNDSLVVGVRFISTGRTNGRYDAQLIIGSNDPTASNLVVPATMIVDGPPELSYFSDTCLIFDTTMVSLSTTDSLGFYNGGCDTLFIDSLVFSVADFTIDTASSYIPPGEWGGFLMTFTPSAAGLISDMVFIYTNDVDTFACVQGFAIDAPAICYMPDSFSVTLACADTLYDTLKVCNTGPGILIFSIAGSNAMPPPASCTPGRSEACCPMGPFNVTLNTINNNSGGGDLGYQDFTGISTLLERGKTYPINVTTNNTWNENLRVWIDFNNDGSFAGNEIVFESLNTFQNHSGQITIPSSGIASGALRMRVGSDYEFSAVPTGCSLMQYGQYEDYTVRISSGVGIPSVTDTVVAGDTSYIPMEFISTGLTSGTYRDTILIQSNDPANPTVTVPVQVVVDGPPELSYFSDTCLIFDTTMVSLSTTDSLGFYNGGCDTLFIDSLVFSVADFTIDSASSYIPPGEWGGFFMTFTPSAAGLISDMVFIYTNDVDTFACVQGFAIDAPAICHTPDSFSVTLACADTLYDTLKVCNTGPGTLIFSFAWSNAMPPAASCTPGRSETCCPMGPFNVTLNTINNSSGGGDLGYQDFTGISTLLERGETYPINVTTNNTWNENLRVWIDFNNDGSFAGNEIVFESLNTFQNHSGQITIPSSGIASGALRMRAGSDYEFSAVPTGCSLMQYGQYEDYTVRISSTTDTVVAGDTSYVPMEFISTGLTSGTYRDTILIQSNDPANPTVTVPVQVVVDGSPEIAFSSSGCLYLDSIMVYTTNTDTLWLYNTGCDTLHITGSSFSLTEYSANPSAGNIPPFDSVKVVVTFAPTAVGSFPGTWTIAGDFGDGDTTICVTGKAFARPILSHIPDSFIVTINSCCDSVSDTLTIYNTGGNDLTYDFRENYSSYDGNNDYIRVTNTYSGLDAVTVEAWIYPTNTTGLHWIAGNARDCCGNPGGFNLYINNTDLAANVWLQSTASTLDITAAGIIVPNQWQHVAMTFDGTQVRVYRNGQLAATSSAVAATGIMNSSYNFHIGVLAYNAPSSYDYYGRIDEVRIWNGARSQSAINSNYYRPISRYSASLIGYWNFDGQNANDLTKYGNNGTLFGNTSLPAGGPFTNSWSNVSPPSGTILPSDSAKVGIEFSTCGQLVNTYNHTWYIQSNDPLDAVDSVMLDFTVNAAPEISLSDTCLYLDSIMEFTTNTDSVYIRNTGCDTLFVTNITTGTGEFTADTTSFLVEPGDSQRVRVTFSPASTGTFADVLTIFNNDKDTTVCLSGKAFDRPVACHTPDSFNVTLACSDTSLQYLKICNTGAGSTELTGDVSYIGEAVFFDNFEDGIISDWTMESGAYTKQVTGSVAANGSYSLELVGGVSTHLGGVSHTFPQSQPGYVSFYLRKDNAGAQKAFVVIGNNPVNYYDGICYFWLNGGSFYVNDGNYGSVSPNVWYFVEFRNINWTTKTYDVYVDNALLRGNTPFRNTALTSVNEVHFYNWTGASNGYLDDIRISQNMLSPWLSIAPDTVNVTPGDTDTVVVTFTSTGQLVGVYRDTIIIATNDPLNPYDSIPVVLNVVGAPTIELSDTCLYLDSIMEFTTHTDSVYIRNTGCDTLFVTNITTGTGEFTVDTTSFLVDPGDSQRVRVTFSPASTGTFADVLTIFNNDKDTTVCLSGKAFDRPVACHTPDSFNVTLACSDTSLQYLKICNTGAGSTELTGDVSYIGEAVFFDNFEDGSISDWTMESGAYTKQVTGSVAANGAYSLELVGGVGTHLGGVSHTFPQSQPEYVSFYLRKDNAGAQKAFVVIGNNPVNWSDGICYFFLNGGSFYVNDGNYGSVSPNVWYFVEFRNINWTTKTYDVYVNNALLRGNTPFRNTALTSVNEVHFYNWTGASNGYLDDIRIRQSMVSPWLSIAPDTVNVMPGDTDTVVVTFTSTGQLVGVYRDTIIIATNDPLNPYDSIPVVLNVVGAPTIELSDTCLYLDSIMEFTTHTDTVFIRNTGCDILSITGISIPQSEFTANPSVFDVPPGDSIGVVVTFSPTSTGVFSGNMTIANNDTDTVVCLIGKAYGRPVLLLEPDTIDVTIAACCDSSDVILKVKNTGQSDLYWSTKNIGGLDTAYVAVYNDNGTAITSVLNETSDLVATAVGTYNAASLQNYDILLNARGSDLNQADVLNWISNGGVWIGEWTSNEFPVTNWGAISGPISGAGTSGSSSANILDAGHYLATSINWASIPYGANPCDFMRDLRGISDPAANVIVTVNHSSYPNNPLLVEKDYGSGKIILFNWDYRDQPAYNAIVKDLIQEVVRYGRLSRGADWLTADMEQDTVAPGDSSVVTLRFNSCGKSTGTYNTEIIVFTNNPLNTSDTIPVTFTVTGAPVIALSDACLDLDSIMEYTTHTDSLYLRNDGCDTLFVTGMNNALPEYTVSGSLPDTILPGDSLLYMVTFSPVSPGTYTDTIAILNNDADTFVCLTGDAFPRPVLSFSRDTISVQLTSCCDSTLDSVFVYNTGGNNLSWQVNNALPAWLTININSDNVAPGDSSNVITNINACALADGNYYAYLIFESNDPLNDSDTVVVHLYVVPPPPPPSANDVSVCDGSPVPDLTATGTGVQWYDDAALTTLVYSGSPFPTGETAVGTYTYWVTQTIDGCEGTADSVNLFINNGPAGPPATSPDTAVCFGEPNLQLSAAGTIVQWYTDAGLTNLVNTGTTYTSPQTAVGVYMYFVTDSTGGCPASLADSIRYEIRPIPAPPTANDTSVCFGFPAPPLIKMSGDSIHWYTDPGLTNLVFIGDTFFSGETVVGTHRYYITQKGAVVGCESTSSTADLVINPAPNKPNVADTAICFGDPTPTFTASGTNIRWYDDSLQTVLLQTGASFNPGETAVGVYDYFVTDSSGGCTTPVDKAVLTIKAIPAAPVAGDANSCFGDAVPDLISTGSNVRWYNDAGLNNLVYTGSPFPTGETAAGTYTYYATQTVSGCESAGDAAILTIIALPVTPAATDKAVCFGNPTPDLTSTGTNVKWYDDAAMTNLVNTGTTFATGETAVGTYTYYVTDSANGCESVPDTAVLTINAAPGTPTASDAAICFGDATPDLTSTGTIVQWYDDAALTNLVYTGSPFATGITAAGAYTFYVTDSTAGCPASLPPDTAVLTIYTLPAQRSGNDTTVCFGDATPDLIASGDSIRWYDDGALTNLVHDGDTFPTGETAVGIYTYYVTETDTATNCEGPADTVVLNISAIPSAPTASGQQSCFGDAVPDLTATGTSLRWYDDAGLTNLVATGSPFATGQTAVGTYTYYVTQSIGPNCESSATTVTLDIYAIPAAPATADQQACFNTAVPDLTAAGSNIAWYDDAGLTNQVGAGSPFATGQTAVGSYKYYVTQTVNGCESPADSAVLTIIGLPAAPASGDTAICFGSPTPDLTATGNDIKWYDDAGLTNQVGAGSPFATGQTAVGVYTYYVTQTDGGTGCTSPSTTVVLTINAAPGAPASSDTTVCSGNPTPDLIAAGTFVQWYDDAGLTNLVHTNDTFPTGQTAPGAYVYYVTDSVGSCPESPSTTVTLTINATPAAPTAANQEACFGDAVPDLTSTGTNVQWYDDGALTNLVNTGNTFTTGETAVGAYTWYVTQTASNCESPADTVTLTIHPIPPSPAAASPTICFGDATPDLIATTGVNIRWYDDAGLTNLVQSNDTFPTGQTVVGSYTWYVTQTVNNCESPATTVTLTINAIPAAPVSSDTSACYGDQTPILIASPDNNVRWYDDAGLTNLIFSGDTFQSSQFMPGNYAYFVTQTVNNCESPPTYDTLFIYATPTPSATDTAICFGDATPDLTCTGANVKWYDDAGLTNLVATGSPFATGQTATGSYTYYVTNTENGCPGVPDTSVLTINPAPAPPATGDTTVCEGDPVPDLTAAGTFVRWYDDAGLSNLVFTGDTFATGQTMPGSYVYYVTDSVNGCAETTANTATLTINATPAAPVAGDTSTCFGDPVPDLASTGSNVRWYDDGTLTNLVNTGNAFATGETAVGTYTYYVTQTLNNCEGPTDTVTLTINAAPAAPAAPNMASCAGDPVPDLTATGTIPKWYDDAGRTNLVFTGSPFPTGQTAAGTYTYYVVDSVPGCSAGPSTTVTLTINPIPAAPAAADTAVCAGSPTPDLIAAGSNVRWYDDALLTNLVFSGDTFATGQIAAGLYPYYVTQTVSGCESPADTVLLAINAIPAAPVSQDTAICSGNPTPDLTATGTSVQWYDDAGLTNLVQAGNTFATGETATGTYIYYVTQTVNNCESPSLTVTLTIDSTPPAPLAADTAVCFGAATPDLTAGGSNVRWYDDAGLTNLVFSGDTFATGQTAAGTYVYYLTQTVGSCAGPADTVTLSIYFSPAPTALDTVVCAGGTIPDLTSTGSGVTWYDDAGLTNVVGTGNTFASGQSAVGTYTWYVTQTVNGCESTADTSVLNIIASSPPPTVSNPSVCEGDTVPDLTATGSIVQWYSDATLTNRVFSGNVFPTGQTTAGTYTYYVMDSVPGCESPVVTSTLTIIAIPAAPATWDTAACAGSANPPFNATGSNVQWYSDAGLTTVAGTGNSFTAPGAAPGVYTYYVTQTVNGCESPADSATLTIYALPAAPVASDTAICFGNPAPDLTATGSDVLWFDDAGLTNQVGSGNAFTTGQTNAGTYVYFVADRANGCIGPADTAVLTINAIPATPPAANRTACQGSPVPDLTAAGQNIRWYSDSALTTLVFSGDTFATGNTALGTYTYYVTQTVNGCTSPARQVTLSIVTTPPAPVAQNRTGCSGSPIPDLTASGNLPQWYDDAGLSSLVFTGSPYPTGQTAPGVYTYYVTDSLPGCVSPAATVTLTINAPPAAPVGQDVTICYGTPTPPLTASGSGTVQWYADPELIVLIGTGNSLLTGKKKAGIYYYYITDNVTACAESASDTVTLTINPTPLVTLNTYNTTINQGDSVLLIAYNATGYTWSPATGLSATTGAMVKASPSVTTTYIVTGTNTYGCTDTAAVTVNVNFVGLYDHGAFRSLHIFPNPSLGAFTVTFSYNGDDDVTAVVYNSLGQAVAGEMLKGDNGNYRHVFTLEEPPGLYYVQIATDRYVLSRKVLVR